MRTLLDYRLCLLFVLILALAGCSSSSSGGGGSPDVASGNDATTGNDASTGNDSSSTVDIPSSPVFPECPGTGSGRCATPSGDSTECPSDTIMFSGLRWDEDIVVFWNRTGAAVELTDPQVVSGSASWAIPGSTMQHGDKIYVHTNESDPGDAPENHYFLGAGALNLENVGEIALYETTSFTAGNMRAFAIWGYVPTGDTQIDVAVSAGIWPSTTDFITSCDEAVGFVSIRSACDGGACCNSQPAECSNWSSL